MLDVDLHGSTGYVEAEPALCHVQEAEGSAQILKIMDLPQESKGGGKSMYNWANPSSKTSENWVHIPHCRYL